MIFKPKRKADKRERISKDILRILIPIRPD
nr:MAG TPA: hypothetical protein [Caudoviricetes sp.]